MGDKLRLRRLTSPSPAALMPPGTLVYAEIGRPGDQVEKIVQMLKGTPLANPLAAMGGGPRRTSRPSRASPGLVSERAAREARVLPRPTGRTPTAAVTRFRAANKDRPWFSWLLAHRPEPRPGGPLAAISAGLTCRGRQPGQLAYQKYMQQVETFVPAKRLQK